MSKSASILLLDDGELDRVRRLLERLGADFVHLSGDEIGAVVDSPSDLLITTGKRALEMPAINPLSEKTPKPTWICIHGHDVSDLRDRLREQGVHFLVHSALDQMSLQLLVEQVLYQQADRRKARRLPLGVEIAYRVGNELDKGRLGEISRRGCRILTADRLYKDTKVTIFLPRELTGGEKIGLPGRVVRGGPYEPQPGVSWHSSVLLFDSLEEEPLRHLISILSGATLGTRVTPLEASGEELELTERDRRRATRHLYERRMALLGAVGVEVPQVMLGRDVSMKGLRIARHPGLREGMQVAVAMYGNARAEPIVLQAEVVSDYGERGLGLEFHCMTPEQRRRLEAFVSDLPPLEEVCSVSGETGPVVVSQILDASAASDAPQE